MVNALKCRTMREEKTDYKNARNTSVYIYIAACLAGFTGPIHIRTELINWEKGGEIVGRGRRMKADSIHADMFLEIYIKHM